MGIYRLFLYLILFFFVSFNFAENTVQVSAAYVGFATVKDYIWNKQIETTGTVSAINGVMIRAEASGRITKVYIKSSQIVKVGDPLYQINPYPLRAQLDSDLADLKLTQIHHQQTKVLVKDNSISAYEDEKAQAAYFIAKARVAKTKALIDLTLVKAPFDGQLGLKRAFLGEYVNIGDPLIPLQNLDKQRVDFAIPQIYLNHIAVGQQVTIKSPAYPNKVFHAKVFALDKIIDKDNRTIMLRAELENVPKTLIPGLYGDVVLTFTETEKVIAIPLTAVNYELTGSTVFKVQDGIAVLTNIKLGEQRDNLIAVKGLKPGDIVVSEGRVKIHNGMAVIDKKQKSEAIK